MSPRRSTAREVPEIVTLILSIGIISALVGGVVFVQLGSGDRPPAITAAGSLDDVRVQGGQFYLTVEVRNEGDQAAEAIRVVVVQQVDGRAIEHELLVDYLAGGGVARATAVLGADPRSSMVTVEVRSFQSGN